MEEVYNDELQKIRIEEETMFFQRGCSPMKNAGGEDELDYNKGFWALWPFTIEEHVAKINEVLTKVNLDRKEKYQQPIKFVSKKELAKFYALILAASIFLIVVSICGIMISLKGGKCLFQIILTLVST